MYTYIAFIIRIICYLDSPVKPENDREEKEPENDGEESEKDIIIMRCRNKLGTPAAAGPPRPVSLERRLRLVFGNC